MRVFGALLLVVLLAVAITLYLQSESTSTSFDAVLSVAAELQEEGVEARPFDLEQALQALTRLEDLLTDPEQLSDHVDEFRAIAATAASWAAAALSPSVELTVAVALRSAAGAMRSYATTPSPFYLQAAAGHLAAARSALSGEPVSNNPAGAIRDRLKNLEQSHRERYQDLSEELSQ